MPVLVNVHVNDIPWLHQAEGRCSPGVFSARKKHRTSNAPTPVTLHPRFPRRDCGTVVHVHVNEHVILWQSRSTMTLS